LEWPLCLALWSVVYSGVDAQRCLAPVTALSCCLGPRVVQRWPSGASGTPGHVSPPGSLLSRGLEQVTGTRCHWPICGNQPSVPALHGAQASLGVLCRAPGFLPSSWGGGPFPALHFPFLQREGLLHFTAAAALRDSVVRARRRKCRESPGRPRGAVCVERGPGPGPPRPPACTGGRGAQEGDWAPHCPPQQRSGVDVGGRPPGQKVVGRSEGQAVGPRRSLQT
jgi:hypothetical protein